MSRTPIGEVAMTCAERSRRYRARRKERPAVKLEVAARVAAAALHELWLAVLHAGPPVDATQGAAR